MLGCKECCFAIEVRLDELNCDDYVLIIEGLCSACTKVYWALEETQW